MNTILIMMSTFNGEKYLAEQLDSILSQKEVNVHLLIRDDGSSDTTPKILEKYKNDNPSIIDVIQGENIGWKKSFFSLIEIANQQFPDHDYFSFSDQDDIWLPEKLERSLDCLSSLEDGPQLYSSNLTYYKDGQSGRLIRNEKVISTYKNCMIRNYATGCTIVFNKELLKLLNKETPHIPIAHDYWCFMVASLCGKVYVDDKSFILYRQHGANQIGTQKGFFEVWKRRLHSLRSLMTGKEIPSIAAELHRIHADSMNDQAKESLEKLINYKNNLYSRLSLLLDRGYTFNKFSNDIWLKLRIISGRL